MSSARGLAGSLCLLLVVSAVAPSIVAGGAPAPQTQPAVDNTVTRIQVHPSGNATWSVAVRTRLETESEVEQYRAFQDRFRNNTSRYLDTFGGRIRSVVADAENVTDREMRAVKFSAATHVQEVPRRWGVITYRFRWTNFATAPNASTLVVGDVFQGGYYLAEDDIVAVRAPDGYSVAAASPDPDERERAVVRWFGPHEFADGHPSAAFRAEGAGATATGGAAAETTEPVAESEGGSRAPFVAGVLLALGAGAVAVWRVRSDGADPSPDEMDFPSPTEPRGGDGDARVVTDAERVETLLRERGGRLKQAAVADALDWSASKTSRVLSDLEDDGVVERVRVGRENVVDLSDASDE